MRFRSRGERTRVSGRKNRAPSLNIPAPNAESSIQRQFGCDALKWGCFENLPEKLTVHQLPELTFNWLAVEPDLRSFKLTADQIDYAKNHRREEDMANSAIASLFGAGAASIILLFGDAARTDLEASIFVLIALAAATACLASYGWFAIKVNAFESAATRREEFVRERDRYADIKRWQSERCGPEFWQRDSITSTQFEIETTELLAGILGTTNVTLTRGSNDYGTDALACSATMGKVVVQCKHWKGSVSAAQVRELAGSVRYFDAHCGILFCLHKPSDETDQWLSFANKFNLSYWNLDCVLAMAKHMSERPA